MEKYFVGMSKPIIFLFLIFRVLKIQQAFNHSEFLDISYTSKFSINQNLVEWLMVPHCYNNIILFILTFSTKTITYFSQELLNPSDKDEGGTIVYTHNLAQSQILHDFGSTEFGATWLKLTHPDPIYDEKLMINQEALEFEHPNI